MEFRGTSIGAAEATVEACDKTDEVPSTLVGGPGRRVGGSGARVAAPGTRGDGAENGVATRDIALGVADTTVVAPGMPVVVAVIDVQARATVPSIPGTVASVPGAVVSVAGMAGCVRGTTVTAAGMTYAVWRRDTRVPEFTHLACGADPYGSGSIPVASDGSVVVPGSVGGSSFLTVTFR